MAPTATEDDVAWLVGQRNLLIDYYDRLPEVIARCVPDPAVRTDPANFSPGFQMPELDERMRRYFAPASARWYRLPSYAEFPVSLLDLAGNPHTNTTKTHASLLIVARAIEYIRRTGEPILIFSPTSANKGTALRDAVARAISEGLVTPDELRVAVLAPACGLRKLRNGTLSSDAELRRRNPLLIHDGTSPDSVKSLGRDFVREYGAELRARYGTNVWFSLDLTNYLIADASRAFFEQDVAPPVERPRIHVHAVSSAFGLIGYDRGREILAADGPATSADRPGFLLVQHLGAPDMVLSLAYGDFDRMRIPAYSYDPVTGLHTQSDNHLFPYTTDDPGEVLDPTFYTRHPATSPRMNELIGKFGGGGIVVSLRECVDRYPRLRAVLAGTEQPLPADLRDLQEWSLVMALTGAFNAVDRGLLPGPMELVVHNSGSYTTADYEQVDRASTTDVADIADIADAVMAGC